MGKPVQLDRLNEVLTFLEPHAMSRLAAREHPNRRQSPRARLSIPVSLREYGGRELAGQLIEAGVTGMQGAPVGDARGRRRRPSSSSRSPDGGPPLEVVSILVRTDPDGYAFTFVRLGVRDAERLRELLRSAPGIGAALAGRAASHRRPRASAASAAASASESGPWQHERAIAQTPGAAAPRSRRRCRVPLGGSRHRVEEAVEVTDHAATDVAVPLDELRRPGDLARERGVPRPRIARPRRAIAPYAHAPRGRGRRSGAAAAAA